MALIQTGDRDLAIWPLKRAMEAPDWLKRAGLPLAELLLSSGAHGDAIAICDRILEAEPDDIPALIARANARMLSRRDYEGSLADAERVPDLRTRRATREPLVKALDRIEDAASAIDQLEALFRDDSLGLHGNAGLCGAREVRGRERRG
jgi:hypothetical protein